MSERIRSGIYFDGPRMRYSEVGQGRSGLKLLRLGSCDFDFDAGHALLAGKPRELETIGEAVSDVFSGSKSVAFTVVLSSASVISFFSPVSDRAPDSEKRRQLETDTLIIGGEGAALSVVAESVASSNSGSEEPATWYYVAAVPARVRRNLSVILASFGQVRHHFMTSMQAAVRVAGRLERISPDEAAPAAAVVGLFQSHTEIAILESSKWLFGATSTSTLPGDVAYAILNLARKANVEPADLGRIHLYGDTIAEADLPPLRAVVAASPSPLDPLALVRSGSIEDREGFDPGDYVLSIGAAL